MKKLLMSLPIEFIILISLLSMTAYADGDEAEIFKRWFDNKNSGISTVQFQQYTDICGRCHFPYQPGLLPGISWEKLMLNTNEHFGQSLNMTEVEIRSMIRYLLDNSAGHVNDEISSQILKTLEYNPIPIRITKTPYFIKKHNYPGNNKNIVQCDSCHQDARVGGYKNDKLK